MSPAGRIRAAASMALAFVMVAGFAVAQSYPTRGRMSASGGGAASSLAPGATGTTLALSGALGTGGNLSLTQTASPNYIISSTASGTASSTIAAIGVIPVATLGAGDLIFGVGNESGVMQFGVDYGGGTRVIAGDFSTGTSSDVNLGRSLLVSSYTDDSANSGNRTVDKVRGKNAVAIGATTAVITNSFVTTNSQIIVTLESTDATALYLRSVVPSGTGFTVTLGPAAATAAVKFSWLVIN